MKRPWLLVAAWLLLLLPTLAAGHYVYRLLLRQQEQISTSAKYAIETRAGNVAEAMALTIEDVKQGLMDNLQRLHTADELMDWKARHPLIRNVFVWDEHRGLLVPNPERPASDEDARFIERIGPLFEDESVWRAAATVEQHDNSSQVEYAQQVASTRGRLRSLAERPAQADQAPPVQDGGWIPWFNGQELALLAWRPDATAKQRIGLELEVMALVSRLMNSLPVDPPPGQVYALRDGMETIVYQTGADIVREDTPVIAGVAVGTSLPHWSVAVYQTGPSSAVPSQNSLRALTLLVVVGVMGSILLGGSLLLWQAWRAWQDARQKTSFVSNVSHELKTPLTTIRMYAELLGEGRVQEKEKKESYLQTIVGESQRLTRLVNNVLDFSRLEQGRKKYALERMNLAQLAQDVLDTQRVRLIQASMQVQTSWPDQPCMVTADRDAVEQVILNVTDNAIKYAGDGVELKVELVCNEAGCHMTVEDRGPGVPATHRKQVFEKFHRVDDSLTAKQPGSGLGLSIARQLMRDMGGDLTCSDRPGGGARFTITLPQNKDTLS